MKFQNKYRRTIVVCLSVVFLLVAAFAVVSRVRFLMLTGHVFPIHKIEHLNRPVLVKGWATDRLLLVDGYSVRLQGIHDLPSESPALSEMTKRGVEIDSNGCVYGLVRIHHWCGNDPVREHLARVDLTDALIFLHIGHMDLPVPVPDSTATEAGGRFTEWGWNISEYTKFLGWQRMKNSDP